MKYEIRCKQWNYDTEGWRTIKRCEVNDIWDAVRKLLDPAEVKLRIEIEGYYLDWKNGRSVHIGEISFMQERSHEIISLMLSHSLPEYRITVKQITK